MLKNTSGVTLAIVGAMAAAAAHAQTGPTREQVRAETLAAIRNGDMVMPSGMTPRAMFPDRYPAAPATPVAAGPTRSEVVAETQAAIRNGEMVAPSGMTARAMTPGLYPAPPEAEGATRREVKAELAEATRKGELMATGRADLMMREEFPQRYGVQ